MSAVPVLPEAADELDQLYADAPDGVRANMLMSADAAAAFHGRTRPLSDNRDLSLLLHLRRFADVVLVGAGTVRAENYGKVRLPAEVQQRRVAAGYAAIPPVAVVTASGDLNPTSRLFTDDGPPPLVLTVEAVADRVGQLGEVADVVAAGSDRVTAAQLVAALRDRGLQRMLCEGGPTLLAELVDADLVDDMCLTVSPYLAGAQPVRHAPPASLAVPRRLTLRHVRERDGMVYLRYSRATM